jgi:hypothetical protein
MKKLLLIVMGAVLLLSSAACKAEQGESEMKKKSQTDPVAKISVSFINDVETADVWILPQTEENLKTTVWGTATFSKMKTGEKGSSDVSDAGSGKYIIRIIDTDHAYYAVNDIELGNGYSIRFMTDSSKYDAEVIVLDEKGNKTASKENVFEGVLGAR